MHTPLRRTLTLGIATTIVALVSACGGDAKSAIESEIAKGVSAVQNKDLEGYLNQIPSEALAKDTMKAGPIRDMLRDETAKEWATIAQTRSIKVTVDSVYTMGDSAIVVSKLHWDRFVFTADRKGQDTVITDILHREVWRRTPAGWRSFKVIAASGTNSVNGKVTPFSQ